MLPSTLTSTTACSTADATAHPAAAHASRDASSPSRAYSSALPFVPGTSRGSPCTASVPIASRRRCAAREGWSSVPTCASGSACRNRQVKPAGVYPVSAEATRRASASWSPYASGKPLRCTRCAASVTSSSR
ncbi:hypothetical protein [Kineococcus auxinigenes]|uniref:hypothetical protein n=1 Tax=Kineococcus sp. SYSU DK028 TaxID=3383149 RepID=UPI003D7E8142